MFLLITNKLAIVFLIITLAMFSAKIPNTFFKGIRRASPFIAIGILVLKLPDVIDLTAQVINTLWPVFVGVIQNASETLADMMQTISK